MNYRVIALDLDGTLLTSRKTVLPDTVEALMAAKRAGAEVILVTGRHHSAIHPFYRALELSTPVICCNGTYLYDYATKQVLANDPMTLDQAELILRRLEEHGIEGLLYADDAMLYRHPTPHVVRTQAWGETLPTDQRPVFQQVPSLFTAAAGASKLWKFALSHPDTAQLNHFARQVTAEAGVTCEWSWVDQVDIAQQGNNKGKRLKQWLDSKGISPQEVIAFGDNYNDLSMLESVGLGAAMGNADDEIKSRAGLVIGDNDRPSIAETVQQKVLSC